MRLRVLRVVTIEPAYRVDVLAQWQPPLTHTATVLCEVDGGAEPAEGPNRVDFALRPDAGLCVHDGASW